MKTAAQSPQTKQKTYAPVMDAPPLPGMPARLPGNGGVYWLRMPLPFALDHINLWLIEGAQAWAIVDSGFQSDETIAHWENVFVHHFARKPVTHVVVTHFHPDHMALAQLLSEKTGAAVEMTQPEYDLARLLCDDANADALAEKYRAHYRAAGFDESLIAEMTQKSFSFRKSVRALPPQISAIRPGDMLALGTGAWRVIGGYGHSPEHACLYNAADGILISGDIVLPDISPNIGLYPGYKTEENPVQDYLDTLDRIQREVPDDVMVLPSHGVPFKGLHRRIEELRQHHCRRLENLRRTLAAEGPHKALDAMRGLFAHRELGTGDLPFALAETLSHLAYEEKRGQVQADRSGPVTLYRLAS